MKVYIFGCEERLIFSTDESIACRCHWASMFDEAEDFHTQRCEFKRGYIDHVAECEAAHADCLAEC